MVYTSKVVLQVCIYNIAHPIETNLFEQIFQGLMSGPYNPILLMMYSQTPVEPPLLVIIAILVLPQSQ